MKKIHKDDQVIVIAGAHKGKSGRVVAINWKTKRLKIDKVNIVKKHVKPSQTNPDGGIQELESGIHISNVKLKSKDKKTTKKKVIEKIQKVIKPGKKATSEAVKPPFQPATTQEKKLAKKAPLQDQNVKKTTPKSGKAELNNA